MSNRKIHSEKKKNISQRVRGLVAQLWSYSFQLPYFIPPLLPDFLQPSCYRKRHSPEVPTFQSLDWSGNGEFSIFFQVMVSHGSAVMRENVSGELESKLLLCFCLLLQAQES